MPAALHRPHRPSAFSSLASHDFRLFIASQLISYTGGWVQRIAQDWLVLSLTGRPSSVGITVALQFLPSILLSPLGGAIADRYPKRWVIVVTTTSFTVLAGVLATLTLSGRVSVTQVYLLAFLTGTVIAVDNPTRQSFVTELVDAVHIRSAIGLNSSAFQVGALLGPAVSGVLINAIGPGWLFTVNAGSFLPALAALFVMRPAQVNRIGLVDDDNGTGLAPEPRRTHRLREAASYVHGRPTIVWPIVLAGCFSFFTINLTVTLAAYAKTVAHTGAGGYGALSSTVAVGALLGALASARRPPARLRALVGTGALLAGAELLAGLAPTHVTFAVLLVPVGALTVTLFTSANATVQLSSRRDMRGRVMGIYLLVFMGAGALGGPVVGYLDEGLGARSGLLSAGLVSLAAVGVVGVRLAHVGHLRLRMAAAAGRGWRVSVVHRAV